jgi:transposase
VLNSVPRSGSRIAEPSQVYLACGATDMRKSIDALAAIVTYTFELDPFSPSLFVFCNRGRDKLKILYWENNGFWLLYRRLEKGRFRWPTSEGTSIAIDRRQLQWLLDGLELQQARAHAPLQFKTAA